MQTDLYHGAARERTGLCRLSWLQLRLLLRKNLLVHWRNLGSTLLQLALPLFCMLLLLCFQADDKFNTDGHNSRTFQHLTNPPTAVTPMPTCGTGRPGCTTPLAIVQPPGSASSRASVEMLVDKMLAANPQVAAFGAPPWYDTSSALNAEMAANPTSVLAALHFPAEFSLAKPEVTLQFNYTRLCKFAEKQCDAPWATVQFPVQVALERALLSQAADGRDVMLSASYSPFPNPALPQYARDLGQFFSPVVIVTGILFNFVVQLNQLVREKELRLRLLLRIFGARDGPMWASWYLIYLATAIIGACLWLGFG